MLTKCESMSSPSQRISVSRSGFDLSSLDNWYRFYDKLASTLVKSECNKVQMHIWNKLESR